MKNQLVLLRNVFRYFVAFLFLFSGFVKIVDPIGTAIKLEKYFVIFSENFSNVFELFLPYTLPIAILIIASEMILGFALLFLYQMRITSWALLGLILFFTVLTFYTAITGNPKDCGCFGDFMKLTPWQSFGKDVILSMMIFVIFKERNNFESKFNDWKGSLIIFSLSSIVFYFAYYNLAHLPVIDFRPYKIGNYLPDLMKDGVPAITHYELKKNGEKVIVETFKNEHAAPPYEYVGTVTIKEPELPTIVDFNLYNNEGELETDRVLEGVQLLIVVRKIKPLGKEVILDKIRNLENDCVQNKIHSNIISSIGYNTFIHQNYELKGTFLTLDTDISKAVVRSNVGILLLKDGVVKGKWHYHDTPTFEQIQKALAK